jgi:L-threonylcarbamoyladenylate synthase
MNEQITKAITILKQGGIVIFPTDTAFGIGCRIDDENAVKRLFKIRNRLETKATPVLVSSYKMAQQYWQSVPSEVKEKLIDTYWPGALTIVLPCITAQIPPLVRGGGETIGLRMPNHAAALEIITTLDIPILGPSANFAGKNTPYSLSEVDQELINLVDYIVPGECTLKQASTVVDCTTHPWRILRQGIIKLNNTTF